MDISNREDSKLRRPLYALLLSFGATGLGHIYCGKLGKGLFLFFISLLFTPIIIFSSKNESLTSILIMIFVSIFILFVIFLYAVIDAWLLAKKIGDNYKIRKLNRWYIYLPFIIVSFCYPAILSSGIKGNLIEAYITPSGSMLPSIFF